MHAVVIGGSGQIGGWLLRILHESGHSAVGTYATVPFPGLIPLDARDLSGAAAWVRVEKPDAVFYPAGFTWVDGCERDPAHARAANLDQPLNLARAAAETGALPLFLLRLCLRRTTRPLRGIGPAHPLSVYGQVKLDAEQTLHELMPGASLVLRTTWVFGPERQGKNFAYQLAKALRAGRSLPCPSDQRSTPSYGPDVARAAVLLAETSQSGLIHVAGPDVLGRVEFARALAAMLALDPSGIVGAPTAELGQAAARPLQGGLLTPRLDGCLPGVMRSLADSLQDFRDRLAQPDLGLCPL